MITTVSTKGRPLFVALALTIGIICFSVVSGGGDNVLRRDGSENDGSGMIDTLGRAHKIKERESIIESGMDKGGKVSILFK